MVIRTEKFETENFAIYEAIYLCSRVTISKANIYLVRTQNFQKTFTSYPLIRAHTCAYQWVGNVSFRGNVAHVLMNDPQKVLFDFFFWPTLCSLGFFRL